MDREEPKQNTPQIPMNTQPWTATELLILAAALARFDLRAFYVRRVLQRLEQDEMRPHDAVRLLDAFVPATSRDAKK